MMYYFIFTKRQLIMLILPAVHFVVVGFGLLHLICGNVGIVGAVKAHIHGFVFCFFCILRNIVNNYFYVFAGLVNGFKDLLYASPYFPNSVKNLHQNIFLRCFF